MAVSLFPVSRRSLGIGLGYNVGVIVFGAFAPFITAWLIHASGDRMVTAWYAFGGGFVSVLVALSLPHPKHERRRIAALLLPLIATAHALAQEANPLEPRRPASATRSAGGMIRLLPRAPG
jgi:hypothetical protein